MAGLNVTARNAMLDGAAAVWPPDTVSLHTADPGNGTTPTASTEVTGGSPAYARKSVTWSAAASGSKAASNQPVFDVPGSTTITHLGYWRGSTYLGSRALDTAQTYATQGTYTAVSITESVT